MPEPANQNARIVRKDLDDLSLLAAAAAGEDQDLVFLSNREHHTTSGANEIIFK